VLYMKKYIEPNKEPYFYDHECGFNDIVIVI